MLKRRLHRLVRVYTCQNVKLLEISCRGSYMNESKLAVMGSKKHLVLLCKVFIHTCTHFSHTRPDAYPSALNIIIRTLHHIIA